MQPIRQQLYPGTLMCESPSDVFITPFKTDDLFNCTAIKILKTQNLISLLSTTTANHRTEKQCKAISQLLRSEPFFSNISKNQKILLEISSWVDYRKVRENQFVYQMGEPSDCLYVMLKGEICLTAPEKVIVEINEPEPEPEPMENLRMTKRTLTDPEELIRSTKKNLTQTVIPSIPSPPLLSKRNSSHEVHGEPALKRKLTKRPSINSDFVTTVVAPPKPKPKIETQIRIVRVVDKGEGFGDLGQLFKRGTNAQAKEISHLMVIRKQYFDYLSKIQLKSQSKIKYEFLSSIPFFGLLYKYSLESVIYFLQEKKLGYNGVVFNEEDPIKYVYIVYKGEFKLYKKIVSKKQEQGQKDQDFELEIKSIRIPQKNVPFKTISPGEILGHIQSYNSQTHFTETCICKSQEGVMIRIDKNKFLKKVLSPDNNLEEIKSFIEEKTIQKNKDQMSFMNKQENDQMYIRYLHTPSARSRRVKTENSSERESSSKKDELRRLSTSGDNFFNEFNQTVSHHTKSRRISVNRSPHLEQQPDSIPNSIRDIVQMVKHETNYHKIRKPDKNITLFEFNISKVPLHVKKRFDFLFKKAKKQ